VRHITSGSGNLWGPLSQCEQVSHQGLSGRRIAAALLVVLASATLVQLSLFTSMRPDFVSGFLRALGLSSLLALVPLSVLWWLDRRERETPWLGCIATLNTAFFKLIDEWLALHQMLAAILGPDAPLMLVGPISAPIAEELAKALGVLSLFGCCGPSSTICAMALSTAPWWASISPGSRQRST
jgi:hypothetical protein